MQAGVLKRLDLLLRIKHLAPCGYKSLRTQVPGLIAYVGLSRFEGY